MPWTLEMENLTGRTLTPFPVDLGPPPHRVADPSQAIPEGARGAIDPLGFNPVFVYAPLPKIPGLANGVAVQLALTQVPASILVRTQQFQVDPGNEGQDPALAPQPIEEFYFSELVEGAYTLTIGPEFSTVELTSTSQGTSGGCLWLPVTLMLEGLGRFA